MRDQPRDDAMRCPHCTNANLTIMERQGIEIDCCPQCRGVWLDRGELDKLIERNAPDRDHERDWHSSHAREKVIRRRGRRGLPGELFDLD